MKIGIITHHYVKNYGAFLQARALMGAIEENFPSAEVSLVNYINPNHWFRNILHIVHFKIGRDNLKSYRQKVGQLLVFSKYEHSLPRSKRVHNPEEIEKLGYDVLIIGSDEVWNFTALGYHPLKFGYGFSKNTSISTYAACAGAVTDDTPIPEEAAKGLENLNMISVRDIWSQKFVARASGREAELVLDPTFLYNFDRDIDERNIQPKPYRYILIYECQLTEKQIVMLKKYAAEHDLKVIGGGNYQTYYDDITISLTPYEWVNLFRNAEAVITGTFHGTVFSIKYKKKFVSYPTMKNRILKIHSLLCDFRLEDRLLTPEHEDELLSVMLSEVPYEQAYRRIEAKKEFSLNFLKQALKG